MSFPTTASTTSTTRFSTSWKKMPSRLPKPKNLPHPSPSASRSRPSQGLPQPPPRLTTTASTMTSMTPSSSTSPRPSARGLRYHPRNTVLPRPTPPHPDGTNTLPTSKPRTSNDRPTRRARSIPSPLDSTMRPVHRRDTPLAQHLNDPPLSLNSLDLPHRQAPEPFPPSRRRSQQAPGSMASSPPSRSACRPSRQS